MSAREATVWDLYGAGPEALGRDGRAEREVLPPTPDDHLLVRVDAVGLCFSDAKIITLGPEHPKLQGRDFLTRPVRLGHEVCLTVLEVGAALRERFRVGQRLALQPDIYRGGVSTAYGYTLPGALCDLQLLGPDVLDNEGVCYVFEAPEHLSAVAVALTEPWACVISAYTQRRRLEPLAGGAAWLHLSDVARPPIGLERLAVAASLVVTVGDAAAEPAARALLAGLVGRKGDGPVGGAGPTVELLVGSPPPEATFDDVVLVDVTSAEAVHAALRRLRARGVAALVGDAPLDGPVPVDVGRIHYDYLAIVGTTERDLGRAYGEARNRCELVAGGVTVVVGAAGPMGQMHVQRAIGLDAPPRAVVAMDVDPERLAFVERRFSPLARERGVELVVVDARTEPDVPALLAGLGAADGADDVVMVAAAPALIAEADAWLAPHGMLVLFAGLKRGTEVPLALERVARGGAQYTGTSGSTMADHERVVGLAGVGALDPARSLAAIAGLGAVPEGIAALMGGRFAGKIVILPRLPDLPLTAVDDLLADDAEVRAACGPDGTWTSAAEEVLLARQRP